MSTTRRCRTTARRWRVAAAWFAYDGYLNEGFIGKHTDAQGNAETDLVINRIAPPFLVAGAVLFGVYFHAIRHRKLVADDQGLIVAGKETIPYDAIEKIDKTHFAQKGFFTLTYRRGDGTEGRRKLSDRQYDNLDTILDHLVGKIT